MADFNFVDDFSSPSRRNAFHKPDAPGPTDPSLELSAEATPTEPVDVRRSAAFRPPEEVARRLDVVNAFKRHMNADFNLLRRVDSVRDSAASMLFSSVLADEALGHFDASARTLNDLRRHTTLDDASWRVARRIARQLDAWELVEESLEHASVLEDNSFGSHDALEHAQLSWMQGAPAEKIALLCAAASDSDEPLQLFTAYWRAQLLSDAMLSMGDLDGGMEVLCELADHHGAGLPAEVRQMLEWMVAAWLNLSGHTEEACERLLALDQK